MSGEEVWERKVKVVVAGFPVKTSWLSRECLQLQPDSASYYYGRFLTCSSLIITTQLASLFYLAFRFIRIGLVLGFELEILSWWAEEHFPVVDPLAPVIVV